jgi:hypothetical protein
MSSDDNNYIFKVNEKNIKHYWYLSMEEVPQLRFRDTRRETTRFQDDTGRGAALEPRGFSPGVSKTELREG